MCAAPRPLRIAIDASRTTLARRTGTENYALRLIRALLELDSAHQFTLYFREEPHPLFFPARPNLRYKVVGFPRLWTHLRFAIALWLDRPDVTFVPAHTLPLFFPGRAVVTIHDLGYRFYPEAHPAFERRYLHQTTRFSSRRAVRILADSEATKRDLMGQYGTDAAKIDVVYPGVEGLARAEDDRIDDMRARYKLPARYFLFLGTLQPRKNLQRLAEAFVHYLEQSGDPDIVLVLAGKMGWLLDFERDVLAHLPEAARARIIRPGYIVDEDIAALYSGALGLIFPSLYEGFGFPVLEAMRCGTPILCSNTSSLPELAGEAAILVDPLSVRAIAAGMARLATDPMLRAALIQRGYRQAEGFTWARAAVGALQTLETAASS